MNNLYKKLLAAITIGSIGITTSQAQNHQWTNTFGTPQLTTEITASRAIAIDPTGNTLTVGTFVGTVDFDPGAGVASLTSTSGENGKDVYISKLNAAGNFIWAKKLGGPFDINFPNSANGLSITTDLSSNIIVAGSFSGMIDINPDPATTTILTSLGAAEGFILKLNSNGDYLWSQQIGNTGGDVVNSITTDATGNIYAAGSFAATVDFDGSAAMANVTSIGQSDVFVLKLSATGTFGFVKTFGGTTTEIGNAIQVDGAGNIYTTGYFGNGAAGSTADFDPGAGTVTLTSKGGSDVFISKLNSTGNYVWAVSFGSSVTTLAADQGNAIVIDEQGNVFVAGTFRATNAITPVDFDPGAGVDNKFVVGAQDVFVTKFNATGNYLFSFTAGSFTNDLPYSIAIDAEDNINILGSFSGSMDFDPDPGLDYILTPVLTPSSTNSTDLFLAKYDPTGTLLNVNTVGSDGTDIGYGLVVDGANNFYLTGILSGVADFDPSASTVNITPKGIQDGFVTKWNFCNNIGALPTTAKTKLKSVGLTNLPTTFANLNCEIIAKVTPNGASPIAGNTTAKVWIETVQPNTTNGKFVKRHYEITPAANATTATGKITLYFTQQEFNDFNVVSPVDLPTGPSDITGIANLLVEKKAGISNNGTGLPGSYTNGAVNINPTDADIIWNASTQRWEVSFTTTGFSGFFIKTSTTLLPVRWQNINGEINKKNLATINWKVQEVDVLKYEVEKSIDGITFETLKTVNSIGNGENEYSINDNVKELNTVYYRVKQIDNAGYFSYSSVIKLQPYTSKQVYVYPNPAKDFIAISVGNDYLKSSAQITDMNGKVVKSFDITSNTFSVDVASLAAGMYFLKMENGKTEKIIKQ
jgi:Secretion system C-terminal sorting domain/Beta-propeller repeat